MVFDVIQISNIIERDGTIHLFVSRVSDKDEWMLL